MGIVMIKVREVEDKDLIPLAEFLPKGFPYTTKEFWSPLFELWWTLNPAYTTEIPRGWILEKDRSIVGFIGNIPVRFLVGGHSQNRLLHQTVGMWILRFVEYSASFFSTNS